jgi:integrase
LVSRETGEKDAYVLLAEVRQVRERTKIIFAPQRGPTARTFAQIAPAFQIVSTVGCQRFQLYLVDTGVSMCTRNCIMTGLRFLFRVTLRRLDLPPRSITSVSRRRFPWWSVDEMKRLLAVASSLAARPLSLGYGCGLRASEIVRLKAPTLCRKSVVALLFGF